MPSSWFDTVPLAWYERLGIRILKAGPIPNHIAIIMDGNRRYAESYNMDRMHGHARGLDKLVETFDLCLEMGITELTVYALSIENFKRSKDELDYLMKLAVSACDGLMEDKRILYERGVRVRFLGDAKLMPLYLQQKMAELIIYSKDFTRFTLNMCCAYTAREEISSAMRDIAEGVDEGLLKISDVSEDLLEKCLYTEKSQSPDLMIRTSGEVRFSDFLLWQCTYSCLVFDDVYWPKFNKWHMFLCVMKYQRNFNEIQKAKKKNHQMKSNIQTENDASHVDQEIYNFELNPVNSAIIAYADKRRKRINIFLQRLYHKREMFWRNLIDSKLENID